ncbi:MAG: branched-chain amino acid ABC transporter permease [Chloroflexota bacterium]
MIRDVRLGYWGERRNVFGMLAFILVVLAVPLVFRTPYALSTLVLVGVYTIVTQGLCLLMGYAGQVSLGQAAFFGMGAYVSAILTTRFGWSPWLALVAAAPITGLVAYLFGIPIFRLHGHYLALGTLAFGFIVEIVMKEWRAYTGGPSGLWGIPRFTLGGAPIKTDLAYYYLVWIAALISMAVALNLVHSRFGRALRALRESEEAAESLGIRLSHYKLRALVISAVFASLAGSLYVHYMIFVSPSAFELDVSIRFVLMAAVGGMASIWGAPLGAATVILLSLVLREVAPLISPSATGEIQIVAYGILLVVIMIFVPDGLTVALTRAWGRLGGLAGLRQRWLRRRSAGRAVVRRG